VPIAFELAVTAPNNNVPWVSAAGEAMATWNAVLQRVQLVSTTSSGQPWYDNGRNELFFDRKIYGEPFPNGALAFTIITTDGDARAEADIVFNAGEPWSLYHGILQRSSIDFRRVVVHELGHFLGLDHPDEAGQKVSAIMNSTAGDVEVPTSDDQAGIHALYDRGSNAAPVILNGPTVNSPEVTAGTRVKFTVLAGGRGPYSYTWRRDGVPVPNGIGEVLRLDPVRLSDAGNYTVMIGNGIAATTSSRSVQLKVNPAQPPRIVEVFGRWEVTATAGADYTFEAQGLITGDYPVSFEWKRSGVSVGTTQSPNFTIKDIQFSDSGDYTVTATNIAGSATTRAVHLTVTPGAPPQLPVDYAPVAFAIGSSATLSAALEGGSGPLAYRWKKDGEEIPGASGSTLTMYSFQAGDAGTYTVTVSNAFGRVTSAPMIVTVASGTVKPPLITWQPAAVTAYAGTTVQFSVQVEGSGLGFRWLKDGVPLPLPSRLPGLPPETAGPVFSIKGVKEQDAGVYSVEVSNSLGTAISRGAKLTVMPDVKPLITTQPSAQVVAVGGSIQLSVGAWSPFNSQTQSPGYVCSYQWFKDGAPLLSAATTNTLLFQATLADTGRYFARVTSPTGLTTDSETVVVTVTTEALPVITTQPGNMLIDSSDTEYLRLSSVAFAVLARRAAPGADAALQLVASAGAPIGDITPGTYVVRATKNGVTETSRPFTIGFLPATIPVILPHPQGHVADLGESFTLYVGATAYALVTYQWKKDNVAIPGATNGSYAFTSFSAAQTGSYRVTVTSALGSTTSEPAAVEPRPVDAPVILAQPVSQTIIAGLFVNLSVRATGGALRYQWLKNGQPVAGGTSDTLLIESTVAATGGYSVIVSNGGASVTSRTAQVRVIAARRPPEIVFQPESQTVPAGGDATLVVGADGGPLPDRYQWRKDGVDIPGANDAELRLHGVQLADGGSYTVIAYNSNGSATSAPAVLTVDAGGRLVNIATRASAGTGANVLIAGFVIAGTQPRSVLVRGIGDQLSQFGVTGVLRNPYLQLFDAKAKQVASSDNWFAGSDEDGDRNARVAAIQAAEKDVGAFPLRTDTRDAALIATLAPGSYTAQVSGMVNTTGVALIEVYELGKPSNTRLANLSSRCFVGTGAQILIPGVVIGGQAPRRLLVRAIGPGLAAFSVDNALADPVLTVFRGSEGIAQNDNWSDSPDAAQVAQAAVALAAFPLAKGSKDAALLLELAPGAYTVQVAGAGGSTGVALVEVYEMTR
jgi:hypothetical protein